MQSNGRSHQKRSEDFALVARLMACTKQRDLCEGSKVHADIRERGVLQKNIVLGNTLVNMYAKCGALPHAQQVFDELTNRDVVSWNTLTAGYTRHGYSDIVLNFFKQMQNEALSPDELTFACILKACGNIREVEKGKQLHACMMKSFVNPRAAGKGKKLQAKGTKKLLLENEAALHSALLDMYAKCGAFTSAKQVFDELAARDVVCWTALMAGYCEQGHGEEALDCFEQMQEEGITPDAVTFTCILKACSSIGSLEKGQEIHAEIIRRQLLGNDAILGSALVDMYAKCGALMMAQQVFDRLPIQDVVSWTALLGGYCQQEQNEEALNFFEKIKHKDLPLDPVTFVCLLKACGNIGALEKGEELHAMIATKGLLGRGTVLEGALLDMYVKCGALEKAQQVFEDFAMHDLVSWTVLIAGYCKQGFHVKAVDCFKRLQGEGLSADSITLAGLLKLCGTIKGIEMGIDIHSEIARRHLLKRDIVLGSALIDMYAKCGALGKAQQVFDILPDHDLVSWSALILGYCDHGQSEKAFECFERMKQEGICPNAVTFVCILKACGSIETGQRGKELHFEIARKVLLASSVVLGNAVTNMYATCGSFARAKQMFDELPIRDVVSWNVMITQCIEKEFVKEAFNFYEGMKWEGVSPDALTFACILKACGSMGALEKGKQIHSEMLKKGLIEDNLVLGDALVDMYAKCCAIVNAQQVFDKLEVRDVVSWNFLMTGYCQLGLTKQVFDCYKRMKDHKVSPDLITLSSILKTTGSIGAAANSLMYYEAMCSTYGIIPTIEHHTCMVHLLGRVGLFEKAMSLIKKIPSLDCLPTWFALLSACQNWGNMQLGRQAFDHLVRLGQIWDAVYSPTSNALACRNTNEGKANKVEGHASVN